MEPPPFAVAIEISGLLVAFAVYEGWDLPPLITCIFVTSFSFILGALSMIRRLGVTEGACWALAVMGFIERRDGSDADHAVLYAVVWGGIGHRPLDRLSNGKLMCH